ncbi:unnamed protein product [Penicillium salamii]|uniref:Fungal lipase-type domain-containing protein n=1 Tax=Penicillium salamii TaxID=1612424 RepID=A0A9W4NFT6_9EURO|nr:unnamed protein product [Penicillium salamii]CAG8361291.1 unnamed protein product [Penicillium salamii]
MKISARRALALSFAVGQGIAAVTQGISDNIYNRLVEMVIISQAAYADLQLSATYDHVTLYTFGEPRTGNLAYASYMNENFEGVSPETPKFFRVTHANDGIPTLPPAEQGYVHSGVEYWSDEPHGPGSTSICTGNNVQCCAA